MSDDKDRAFFAGLGIGFFIGSLIANAIFWGILWPDKGLDRYEAWPLPVHVAATDTIHYDGVGIVFVPSNTDTVIAEFTEDSETFTIHYIKEGSVWFTQTESTQYGVVKDSTWFGQTQVGDSVWVRPWP